MQARNGQFSCWIMNFDHFKSSLILPYFYIKADLNFWLNNGSVSDNLKAIHEK